MAGNSIFDVRLAGTDEDFAYSVRVVNAEDFGGMTPAAMLPTPSELYRNILIRRTSDNTVWFLNAAGDGWEMIDTTTSEVLSVNGHTGAVVLGASDVGADATGTAAGLMFSHMMASDPHPQYLTAAEGAAAFDSLGSAASAVSSHAGLVVSVHGFDASGNLFLGKQLDISYGGSPATLSLGAENNLSTRTNNTPKTFRIGGAPYASASILTGILAGFNEAAYSELCWGGGTSLFNAATVHKFFTAANNTTPTGTEAMRIDSAQKVSAFFGLSVGGVTDRLDISAAGVQSFAGAARPKKTLVLTGAGGWPSATNGCAANVKIESATNKQNLYVLDFGKDAIEYAEWTVEMPDAWDGGTVTASLEWTANDATTDAVVWGLQGRAYADGDAIDAVWGTAQEVTDANGGAAYQRRKTAATAAITLAGAPAGGQTVAFRVYRKATDGADTLAADARLLSVAVKYTVTANSD